MESEPAVDHDVATAAMRAQWNRTAKGWHDAGTIIRPWLHTATQAMLGMAGVMPGAHVLDVAAGAGDQTLDIAERVGPHGYVLATDLSPEILRICCGAGRRRRVSQRRDPRFGRTKTADRGRAV